MENQSKDRNEAANRVFFGTGGIFTWILIIGFALYLVYQLYIR